MINCPECDNIEVAYMEGKIPHEYKCCSCNHEFSKEDIPIPEPYIPPHDYITCECDECIAQRTAEYEANTYIDPDAPPGPGPEGEE